ncbi:MAG: phosphoribosyltransferase domain-containing protein [Candidatus Nanohaloarchaeota archaeon QJJ-5]|nr:phosphoribosyltransferase domain-containing protein [Candidatus Nanohaloarchaeota archaeon QJJ-5]
MARSSLSRSERYDTSIETQFDLYDELDPMDWKTEVAVGIAITAYEQAYQDDDDADAQAVMEEFAAPHLEAYHNGDTLTEDTDEWRDRLDDVETTHPGISLSPKSDRVTALGDAVAEEYAPDTFDYVVAPFAGGMAPLYAADQHLDAEPVLIRYSKDRGDDAVTLSPGMEDRFEPDDSSVLIVDDIIEYGSTAETIGQWLEANEEVSDYEMMAAWSLGDETATDDNEPFDPLDI